MRVVIIGGLVLLGLSLPANAADPSDLPVLRGTQSYVPGRPTYFRWEGVYFGGQIGLAAGGANFAPAGNALVANILRETMLESEAHPSTWGTTGKTDANKDNTFGGFVGYNYQWDNVVLGWEVNYNHGAKLTTSDIGSISRIVTLSDNFAYAVTVTSGSSIEVTDFGTVRARAGFAMNNFLPYLMGGLALGNATYSTTAIVSYPQPTYALPQPPAAPPAPPGFVGTQSEGKTNALIYGFALGLGMDVALLSNVFMRAEYEFVQFSQMRARIDNGRVAVGVKF